MCAHARLPTDEIIKRAALALAPILIRTDYNVVVHPTGIVEVRNPIHSRMTQNLTVQWHAPEGPSSGAWYWHWVWSGSRPGSPPEYEPMVPITQPEMAARKVIDVLAPAPAAVRS